MTERTLDGAWIMIEFRFVCPHCGQRMKCDDRLVGRRVRCPGCQRSITLLSEKTPPPSQARIAKPPQNRDKQT